MLTSPTRQRRNRNVAFSLVELLVVTVILGAVSAVVLGAIVTSVRTTSIGEERVYALVDLQRGLERVGRELRMADPLVLDEDSDYEWSIGATVVRNNERINYRYYLADADDGTVELREDVERRALNGDIIAAQDGLFIADVVNQDTGTPLFTYYARSEDGELNPIDCSALTDEQCRNRHLTASQVELVLERNLPSHDNLMRVETTVNIRNTRLE